MTITFKHIGEKLKPPGPVFHYQINSVEKKLTGLHKNARLLDLGSGGKKHHVATISMDIVKKNNVDVIADAAFLPFGDCTFDGLVSFAVLEHVQKINHTTREIHRVLRPGGFLYCEIPFLQTFHADPMDFRRYTLPGIEELFAGYEKCDSGICSGPFSTVTWCIRKIPRHLLGENLAGKGIDFILGWLTFWIKYLDLLPAARRAHQAANGVYFLGEK